MTERPELSEEEMRAQLEQAQARLLEQMEKSDQDLSEAEQLARESLARVEEELDALAAQLQRLEHYRAHPEGAYHLNNCLALLRAKEAQRQLLTIELAALAHNRALAQSGPPDEWEGEGSPFRDPAADPEYGLARVTMDYYLAGFYWLRHLEIADTLLRAFGHEPAILPHNAGEDEQRAERSAALKALIDADPELQKCLVKLVEDVRVAQALLPWAKEALAGLAAQSPAVRRQSLQDPDWNKLNGVMHTLGGLQAAIAAQGALADFDFDTPEITLEDPFGGIEIAL